jgi:peptide/nickel transport system substrate-binding protein
MPNRYRHWRLFVIALAISSIAAVAIACGDDDGDTPTPSPTTPAAATGTPATGTAVATAPAVLKDLVVGIPGDTTNLDGDRANIGQASPNANIFDTLLVMTPDYRVLPHLAESYEFIEPNTWRFKLRKGVKFHDGSELTAADVAWTFDRVARAGGRAINAQEGGTKVIDDYTFEYTPSRTNLKIPLQVVHPIFGIHKAGSDPVTRPIGTGPFKFVSYTPRESLRVERFADYWDKANAAKVASITFRYIPDNNARVLALQAGDVDIITQVPRETVAQLKNRATIVTSGVGAYEALSINIHGEGEWAITRDKAVREAIFKAIDRETLVKNVWEGNSEVGTNLIPPAILGESKGLVKGGPTYDPAGARAILDAAGWRPGSDGIRSKDGQRLSLVLVNGFPSPDIHRPTPEVIQAQLRAVGIEVRIVETQQYDQTLASGQGHLWLERGNQNDANPGFLPTLLYLSVDAGNQAGVDYAKLFAPGASVDTPLLEALRTADIPRTQRLAAEAMRALIDEELVVVPLAGVYNITATSAAISGFKPHSAMVHTNWASVVKN